MSIAVGLPVIECVSCLACSRWAWKRCTYVGSHDSEQWELASIESFEPVPRICRIVLAVYEDDLRNPKWPPPGGYRMDPDCVVKKVGYETTSGNAPPYLIYVDHENHDIVLAIRGLNLAKESDYAVLLDNKLGQRMFAGGYVHNGLLNSAIWLLKTESETLKDLIEKNPSYTLTFAGHSLGSGVAALLTLVVANARDQLGNIPRSRIRCYVIAPARCMSLNLAVRYADIINSVILQDDFLPRTATPLEDIFKSVLCLPCLLFVRCMKDTFISEERKLRDPRRLYAPGRLYHIVERKFCGCGRYPPSVKTAIPVEGRFEHIVLSCNATSDHSIIWIEREAQKALDLMRERDGPKEIPSTQKMERLESIVKEHKEEHKNALERAATLQIPHAFSPSSDIEAKSNEDILDEQENSVSVGEPSSSEQGARRQTNWDKLVDRLFEKDASGRAILKKNMDSI
ncbi:hypothetical protein KI387_024775 [Taxus chinensis]|uniref:Calmodulin-binding heat-shock protein n=1 Tax=Taxus chinensis TaxID=29808 RepID=A0AA38G7B4_TAXCH|nr:hypothetical protein KI387_024775 [Taxus chinensis]